MPAMPDPSSVLQIHSFTHSLAFQALLHRIKAQVCEAAPLLANRLHRHVNHQGQNLCEHLDLTRRRKWITFLLKNAKTERLPSPGPLRGCALRGFGSSFEIFDNGEPDPPNLETLAAQIPHVAEQGLGNILVGVLRCARER